MLVNINGISSRCFAITGLLILVIAIATNNWRKRNFNGSSTNEGIWDDCTVKDPKQICYLTEAQRGMYVLYVSQFSIVYLYRLQPKTNEKVCAGFNAIVNI